MFKKAGICTVNDSDRKDTRQENYRIRSVILLSAEQTLDKRGKFLIPFALGLLGLRVLGRRLRAGLRILLGSLLRLCILRLLGLRVLLLLRLSILRLRILCLLRLRVLLLLRLSILRRLLRLLGSLLRLCVLCRRNLLMRLTIHGRLLARIGVVHRRAHIGRRRRRLGSHPLRDCVRAGRGLTKKLRLFALRSSLGLYIFSMFGKPGRNDGDFHLVVDVAGRCRRRK